MRGQPGFFDVDNRLHRIGLKPVTRRVWAPVGERPIAHGLTQFGWLYVTALAVTQYAAAVARLLPLLDTIRNDAPSASLVQMERYLERGVVTPEADAALRRIVMSACVRKMEGHQCSYDTAQLGRRK